MPQRALYELLGVKSDANTAQIKRGYLKAARRTHPDKCGDEGASQHFIEIGRAYAILSDEQKRKLYDETGIVDEGGTQASGSWEVFWADFYERVSTEKLDKMAVEYRGSADEEADLMREYRDAKGEMGRVLDHMLFASVDDEVRFREKLQELISMGKLPVFGAFVREPSSKRAARQRKAAREAAEAEEHAQELGLAGGSSSLEAALVARIAEREKGRDAFVESLAARYGGANGGAGISKGIGSKRKDGGRSRAAPPPPLDDEAFEAAQRAMLQRAKDKKSKKGK